MQISASMVKELRERTGAGMMECKKALQECGGDMEAAVEALRKKSKDIADKKAGRIAAEGVVAMASDDSCAVMVEVNCETDFVAKKDEFIQFGDELASYALANGIVDLEALMAATNAEGKTFEDARRELIAKIGENISVRRMAKLPYKGILGQYRHGARIGVFVELQGGDAALAKDLCLHIAASNPICIQESEIDASVLDKEREIYTAQAQDSGKPADIIEKMVQGRMKKFINSVTLLGQPFVKNPDQTVQALLNSANAKVGAFLRFGVGEGIEKKQENFADEVMAQVKGS